MVKLTDFALLIVHQVHQMVKQLNVAIVIDAINQQLIPFHYR